MQKLLILSLALFFGGALAQVQLRVIRQWKYLNYTWPNQETLRDSLDSGLYVPENIVVSGIMYHDNWYYLTLPRMKSGVPATLGRITSLPGGSTAPLIEPYPSWEFNKEGDCNALQNVQNVEVDPSGTMWIIDGGHTRSLSQTPVKNCPPKLVLYDVKTRQTKIHVFPENVAGKTDSFLYDLVIDDGSFCYITDNSARDPGIIVYSRSQDRSWKVRHGKSMRADPSAQSFKLNGVPVDAAINVAGIALGPKVKSSDPRGLVINEDREVFYSPLSSLHIHSLRTSVLQDEKNGNGEEFPGDVRDVGQKGSQSDGMIMTGKGILYYGLLPDNAIASWDSQKPFLGNQKVISRDPNYIQWTNSFTIDDLGNLTVLTDTLQKFIHGNLDVKRYNFWLLAASINDTSYLYEDPFYQYAPVEVKKNETVEGNSGTSGRFLESAILGVVLLVWAMS